MPIGNDFGPFYWVLFIIELFVKIVSFQYHPAFRSSLPSPYTFEELQFFSGQYYDKGLNWYIDLFPDSGNDSVKIFEKSATYFDSYKSIARIKGILYILFNNGNYIY